MEQNATSSIVYTNTSLAWQTKSSERCADRQLEHDLAGDLRNRDLHAEADDALEAARSIPRGPEKIEALKKAGLLRSAADAGGISFEAWQATEVRAACAWAMVIATCSRNSPQL